MVVLLPRLPAPAAEAIVRRFLDHGHENWSGFNERELPEAARFAATGGSRITDHQLLRLREGLEGLARKHGYGADSGRVAFARFDAEAAAWIAQDDVLASGEAHRDDVWNFVGAVVAPDIVYWRFGTALERYVGGVRNTFQRLWMRGRALDRGADHPDRWQLLEELTEDALVQITERPSIGGEPVLALAIGEAWQRAARHHGKAAMEPLMRRSVLRIRIKNEIRCLAELPAADLTRLLDQAFGTPVGESKDSEPAPAEPYAAQTDPTNPKTDDSQVRILSAAEEETVVLLGQAADRILAEAERRGLLSPKSRSALVAMKDGTKEPGASERNALEYLLGRLSDASVLRAEVDQVRSAIHGDRVRRDETTSDPKRPRRSRWAIWRGR